MVIACKMFEFEAAHCLPGYKGNCRNQHGHSYKLVVGVSSSKKNKLGMIIDFSKLKKIVKEKIIDKYDHQNLNQFWEVPTAEAMVDTFVVILEDAFPKYISLERIVLYETSSSYIEWVRRDR